MDSLIQLLNAMSFRHTRLQCDPYASYFVSLVVVKAHARNTAQPELASRRFSESPMLQPLSDHQPLRPLNVFEYSRPVDHGDANHDTAAITLPLCHTQFVM